MTFRVLSESRRNSKTVSNSLYRHVRSDTAVRQARWPITNASNPVNRRHNQGRGLASKKRAAPRAPVRHPETVICDPLLLVDCLAPRFTNMVAHNNNLPGKPAFRPDVGMGRRKGWPSKKLCSSLFVLTRTSLPVMPTRFPSPHSHPGEFLARNRGAAALAPRTARARRPKRLLGPPPAT